MHRPTIGAITVALFAIGGGLWVIAPSSGAAVALACIRVGILLAVLWLAQPQLVTLPRWMVITITCALAIVCWRPKALLFALPVLVLLAVMRPRMRSRSSRG